MNFQDWAPLKFVDSKLLGQIRLAYVFGKTGQEALIITEKDEVFACGSNYSYCLGTGKVGLQIEPVKVSELCYKNVKGFSCSLHKDGAFMCAYTSNDSFYIWGQSWLKSKYFKKPASYSMESYGSRNLELVVAAPNHWLILSSDGQIFSYGKNTSGELGRSCSDDRASPIRAIESNLKGKIVTKVSCGVDFSVAVLDNGKVYSWGKNSDGQLGVGDEYQDSKLPKKVSALTNVIIENIICGESYVLAISDVGELYSWGKNDVGQLGLGDTTSRFKPAKVEKIKKVIDIAATAYGSTTAAMTKNNEVYMWGACGDMNLTEPTKTQFTSLFEVFAFFGNPRIMHKQMVRTFQVDSVSDSIRNAFEDSETSDLTIVADKKEIFVHKAILMLRSDYFKVLFQKQWTEEGTKLITLDQNYDGLHAYLQYLYCGKFSGTPEVALESLKIAHEYHDLAWTNICENQVIQNITVENVADLYNLALKLDTKDLAKHCVLFAGKNIGDIVDTPSFSEWDANTYKQFIKDSHKQKQFKY